jgi:hypothetical protein
MPSAEGDTKKTIAMADHRATWVRVREVARQRYPDDDMAAEATARALFDAEEAASYAADLDAQEEEQAILGMARAATRLRGELREELRAEGSGRGGNEDEYVHLDDDDLDYHLAPTTSPTSTSPPTRRPPSLLPNRGR